MTSSPLDIRWQKLVHYIADRFDQPPIPDGLIINAQVLIKRAGGDGHLNKNTSRMLRALGGVPQRGFGNRIVSYKFNREDFFQLAQEGRPLSCEAVRRPKLERQQQAAQ
jgi:hypothetical protein